MKFSQLYICEVTDRCSYIKRQGKKKNYILFNGDYELAILYTVQIQIYVMKLH